MKLRKNIAISESGILFNAATGDSYSVNETGRRIIEAIRDGANSHTLLDLMANDYEISRERVEGDLTDFLSYLKQLKLVDDEG